MNAACAKSKDNLSDVNIRTINYCRSYLEVQRMSDICTADSHYILQSVMDGRRSGNQSQSWLEEIIQERPENKEWRAWRRFLRCYCHEGFNRLIASLGKWMTTIQPSKRLWLFYYSSKNNTVYQGYREDGMTTPSTNLMNMNVTKAISFNLHLNIETLKWNITQMTQSQLMSSMHNKVGTYAITKHSSRNQ